MKSYQDTETGAIHAFDDGIEPSTLNNRNIPTTLSAVIKPKPSGMHVWYQGDWIKQEEAPLGYTQPVSSIPSYNPAWMAYLYPYTAIHRDEASGLNISLGQINSNSYDGNKLAEVVASLPLSTESELPALISYDGAIAIPQCEDFPSNADGVSKLNEILCSLLIGGIHAEVLHSDSLAVGSLENEVRLFAYTPSLHTQLRLNWASLSDRLQPLMSPRVLTVTGVQESYRQGQQVVKAIHNFSPFFLLNGYTALTYRNNNDALNNFWIVVEQLTGYLWEENYEKNKGARHRRVTQCEAKLKKRPGLGTIVAKHKLLRLSKIISKCCQKALSEARVKRNELVHRGLVPDILVVEALWMVLPELIEVASGIQALGLRKLRGNGSDNWAIPERLNFDEWKKLAIQAKTE
jgi:hypothetical protein